jgi:hypothetical protein
MSDDSRKLLKLFGVALTDFETEAERLIAAAGKLGPDSPAGETRALMASAAEATRELDARWIEVTQKMHAVRAALFAALSEGARR